MYSILRALPRAVYRSSIAIHPLRGAQIAQAPSQRFFSVNSRLSFPAAATATSASKDSSATKKKAAPSSKKSTTKKTAAKKKPVKQAAKKKPVKKATKPKKEEVKFKLTKEMMPPTRPPSSFALYTAKAQAGKPKFTSIKEAGEHMKKCAAEWRALSDAEKEPYYTESRANQAKFEVVREDWWRTVDRKVVVAINKKRIAQKKRRIEPHRSPEDKQPMTGYLMFVKDALSTVTTMRDGRDGARAGFREIGAKWQALSAEEKAAWQEQAAKAKAVWQIRQEEKAKAAGASSA